MLALGNVNIYMFEGGTNFGFMNGSNYYDELTPDVTSYDYDALLTEDGQITEKYRRYQQIIAKYVEVPKVRLTTEIKRRSYGELEAEAKVSLFSVLDDLSSPVESPFTQPMEKLGQSYGYILYRSPLATEEKLERIRLWRANDRAHIFVDRKPLRCFTTGSFWRKGDFHRPLNCGRTRFLIFLWKIWGALISVRIWNCSRRASLTASRSTGISAAAGSSIRFRSTIRSGLIFRRIISRIHRLSTGSSSRWMSREIRSLILPAGERAARF